MLCPLCGVPEGINRCTVTAKRLSRAWNAHTVNRNGKIRVMTYARALMRRTEAGKATGLLVQRRWRSCRPCCGNSTMQGPEMLCPS